MPPSAVGVPSRFPRMNRAFCAPTTVDHTGRNRSSRGDVTPPRGLRKTDVWLTGWQVAEDGFDLALDQRVGGALVPIDQDWAIRLFLSRRIISLQRDTYAEATRGTRDTGDWTQLSGRVSRIDQISVRYQTSDDPAEHGLVPELDDAMQHSVRTLKEPRTHPGQIVGWVVRVRG
jgi:hypothetical protein